VGVRAQQPERVRRIGVLQGLATNDPEGQARFEAFLQALEQLGIDEIAVGSTTAMPITPRPIGTSRRLMHASNSSIYTLQFD
jgi:hypothetical protein